MTPPSPTFSTTPTDQAGRLFRPSDPEKLPADRQAKWIFTGRTWRDFNDDQRRRWKEWFAWATSPGGELWSEARRGPVLTGARLDDVELSNACLVNADLSGCSLRNANLHSADLTGARLERAHLEGAQLTHARLCGVDFSHAHLHSAEFTGADLSEARLHAVDLTGVDFKDARMFGTRITDPVWWFEMPRATLNGRTVFPRGLLEHPIQDVMGLPPVLRRRIADAQYLRDMHRKAGTGFGRAVMWVWGMTCAYGQSLGRWVLFTLGLVAFFSLVLMFCPFNFAIAVVDGRSAISEVHRPDFWQAVYFSLSTIVTLGLGDVAPANGAARVLVSAEEICGYIMLGGLLSIFSNKLARLS